MSGTRWPATPVLLASLVDDRLTGAACAGLAPLMDDTVPGETPEQRTARLDRAAVTCRTCSVRIACGIAASEHRAIGIWASELHESRKERTESMTTTHNTPRGDGPCTVTARPYMVRFGGHGLCPLHQREREQRQSADRSSTRQGVGPSQ